MPVTKTLGETITHLKKRWVEILNDFHGTTAPRASIAANPTHPMTLQRAELPASKQSFYPQAAC
jgi:hypothetical protein